MGDLLKYLKQPFFKILSNTIENSPGLLKNNNFHIQCFSIFDFVILLKVPKSFLLLLFFHKIYGCQWGEKRSTSYLMQVTGMAIQRGNSACTKAKKI